MTIWSKGGLSGFNGEKVELCGRIIGQRGREWHFHDGVRPRWYPKEHCIYKSVGHGYCTLTMPQWLVKKAKAMPRVVISVKKRRSVIGRLAKKAEHT